MKSINFVIIIVLLSLISRERRRDSCDHNKIILNDNVKNIIRKYIKNDLFKSQPKIYAINISEDSVHNIPNMYISSIYLYEDVYNKIPDAYTTVDSIEFLVYSNMRTLINNECEEDYFHKFMTKNFPNYDKSKFIQTPLPMSWKASYINGSYKIVDTISHYRFGPIAKPPSPPVLK